jgi:glutamate 5-kinase
LAQKYVNNTYDNGMVRAVHEIDAALATEGWQIGHNDFIGAIAASPIQASENWTERQEWADFW